MTLVSKDNVYTRVLLAWVGASSLRLFEMYEKNRRP